MDGIITESAFADFDTAIREWFDAKLPWSSWYLRPVVWIASAKSGIDPTRIKPIDSARQWAGRPALVIHAEHDKVVLPHNADELATAAKCPAWFVPMAHHANCYGAEQEQYLLKIEEFAKGLSKP